mmetsp:Transcript_32439/g.81735  ORF Transcript_32439/g.81735 Transcript_32439/m.81735 type:complete len:359 (+) Transcript_32439:1-1077(+)
MPNEHVDPADRMGERWFYKIIEGKEVRFRMRMTEDCRQMCVGHGLDTKLIGDDCESSATFTMQVMKGFAALYIRVKQALIPAIVAILDIPEARRGSARFIMTIATAEASVAALLGPSTQVKNDVHHRSIADLLDDAVPADMFNIGGDKGRLELLLAFTNIMSQFDLTLDLTVGTANASGVGQVEHLCGHCYAVLDAHHKASGSEQRCIIEGTNWVLQERRGEQAAEMNQELYKCCNQLSSFLMHITKLGTEELVEDVGKGMVRIVEDVDGGFYRTILCCGDSVQMLKPVLAKDANQKVDPIVLTERVRAIGYEATVPPWSKEVWNDNIFRFFSPCQMVTPKEGGIQPPRHGQARPDER